MMRVPVILVTLSVLFQAAWISAKHIKGSKGNVGVYGGEIIGIEEAPWITQVFASENTVCAGTIVHPRFILTIDTCCRDNQVPRRQWKVRVGSAGEGGLSVKVQEPFKYTNKGQDYNLKPVPCLLKLEKPLKYNQQVQQVSLDEPSTVIQNGTLVDFVAYGRPEKNDDEHRALRRAKLPISDADWCKDENLKRLGGGQICAGNHDHNACAGDAGGALILGRNLIGVLSEATSDCRSNPSRFCRISAYRDWIRTTIADHP